MASNIDWEKFKVVEETFPFTLTDEQRSCIIETLTCNRHMLIIGKPGVGKSLLIDFLQRYLGNRVVCGSTTGISNQRLFDGKGGVGSCHKIFSLPTTLYDETHKKKVTPFTSKLLSSNHELEYILIDEAGFLLNSDYLDLMYHRLQRFNRKYKDRPKRDLKLILVGDFAQLPVFTSDKERSIMESKYGSMFFFKSQRFEDMNFNIFHLNKVNRTKDKTFMAALDVMRNGEESRYGKLCRWANSVMYKKHIPKGLPVITCWNAAADRVNEQALMENPNPEFIYHTQFTGDFKEKDSPVGSYVKLKVGAKVMTIVNDPTGQERFNNGSMGVVEDLSPVGVNITFDHTGITELVELHVFEQKEPFEVGTHTNSRGKVVPTIEYKVTGSCEAPPCVLAYGVSVHKSQGSTISSKCVVDLGYKGFNNGNSFGEALAYVACSRFSNPNDIYLKYPLTPDHIKVNQEILEWLKSLQ